MKVEVNFGPLFITLGRKRMKDIDLARKANISRSIVSNMRNDKPVKLETIFRVAAALEVSIFDVCEVKVDGKKWEESEVMGQSWLIDDIAA